MKKVHTEKAPPAIGPYSQAVIVGEFVFCSGQIALTPDGEFLNGTIEEQTKQVLKNLQAVLQAVGSSLENVVKTTCYLSDINDFQTFNQVYETAFAKSKPARATVEVSKLPKNAKVEIEVIATLG
ncbi:MAG: RidA family protein [Candidatus Levyibacteriota bacterium]